MNEVNEQFSLIYDQYIEKIYRFVYLKVNSQETAEDITSKVFLKTFESYQNSPEKIKNIEAFLYQTAKNRVVDYYREKDKKTVSIDHTAQFADHRINLHQKAILDSDIGLVKSALQNLKKDYQDVIIWHYLEDMSIDDICKILDKSNGAVRVMIHRGLSALKEELGEQA